VGNKFNQAKKKGPKQFEFGLIRLRFVFLRQMREVCKGCAAASVQRTKRQFHTDTESPCLEIAIHLMSDSIAESITAMSFKRRR